MDLHAVEGTMRAMISCLDETIDLHAMPRKIQGLGNLEGAPKVISPNDVTAEHGSEASAKEWQGRHARTI